MRVSFFLSNVVTSGQLSSLVFLSYQCHKGQVRLKFRFPVAAVPILDSISADTSCIASTPHLTQKYHTQKLMKELISLKLQRV